MGKSILQDWVMALGLRHQGCLVSVVRGCDSVGKEDVSKHLVRQIRGLILEAHCGSAAKAKTFMEEWGVLRWLDLFEPFRKNVDHYPHHFLMHVVHAVQIIGYKHPNELVRATVGHGYTLLCRGLHVNPETEAEMDARLNADEQAFFENANCSTVVPLKAEPEARP